MSNVVSFAVENGARHPHAQARTTFDLNDPDDFRDLAVAAIRNSGMTYRALAEKTSLNPQTISRLADGTTTYPRLQTVMSLLFAIGYTFVAHAPKR